MLKFEKNGKIVMTEKDNGELKITEEAEATWTAPKSKLGGVSSEQPGEPGSPTGDGNQDV